MLVSRNLNENLVKIKDLIRLEKNLTIDLININGVDGLFISKNYIDVDIIKFMKQYFGDVRGFENISFTQSLEPTKKLNLEKSIEIQDVNKYLLSNKAVLVIDGVPQVYGIGVDNYNSGLSYFNNYDIT